MTEIEQLRQDIEQAKEIMFRFYNQDRQALGLGEMYDRLAKLEAEAAEKADRWKGAKNLLAGSEAIPNGFTAQFLVVADYARYLEHRVAELEKQLASEKQQVASLDTASSRLSDDLKKGRARIAELEAELAKRPVADPEPTVWGGKADGKWVVDGFGKPLRFYSREAAKYVFSDAVEIEPYTGEQS